MEIAGTRKKRRGRLCGRAARVKHVYASIRHMKRTTVFLDGQLESELKALARRKQCAGAELVREALARYVASEKKRMAAPLSFIAIGHSGHRDTAERHDDLLFEGLAPHPKSSRKRQRR